MDNAAGVTLLPDGTCHHRVMMETQPSGNTCVHACLSSVTGVHIDELIERFGDTPIGREEELCVLLEHGIWPESTDAHTVFTEDGVYLATVPSLNNLGGTHRIVLVSSEGQVKVFDPNQGRDGVRSIPVDALDPHSEYVIPIRLFEIVYLDRYKLRKMKLPN